MCERSCAHAYFMVWSVNQAKDVDGVSTSKTVEWTLPALCPLDHSSVDAGAAKLSCLSTQEHLAGLNLIKVSLIGWANWNL